MGSFSNELHSQYTHLGDVELEVEYLTHLHLDSEEIAEKARKTKIAFDEFLEAVEDLAYSLDALTE